MNPKTKLATFALTITAFSSLLLAGCGEQPAATGDTDAQKQFLEDRQGTPDPNFTPVANIGGPMFFAGPGGPGGPGAFGTVQKVDGRTITLNSPMDGKTTVVHLADSAKVTTQADATLAELKVGDKITAVGTFEGETLVASSIQVGGDDMTGGTNVVGPGGASVPGGAMSGKTGPDSNVMTFDNGTAGTPVTIVNGTPGPMSEGAISTTMQISIGSIETIYGKTITMKADDGKTTTVKLTDTTQFHKQAELDPSKIEVGTMLSAMGELKGDIFEATSAQILPALQMMKP